MLGRCLWLFVPLSLLFPAALRVEPRRIVEVKVTQIWEFVRKKCAKMLQKPYGVLLLDSGVNNYYRTALYYCRCRVSSNLTSSFLQSCHVQYYDNVQYYMKKTLRHNYVITRKFTKGDASIKPEDFHRNRVNLDLTLVLLDKDSNC